MHNSRLGSCTPWRFVRTTVSSASLTLCCGSVARNVPSTEPKCVWSWRDAGARPPCKPRGVDGMPGTGDTVPKRGTAVVACGTGLVRSEAGTNGPLVFWANRSWGVLRADLALALEQAGACAICFAKIA
eukprot:6261337-Amphidinium_carterae.1